MSIAGIGELSKFYTQTYMKRQKESAEFLSKFKKIMKLPKKKKITITQIKKKAWAEFSKYIRLKYADANGMEACYTCGKVLHWKQMQAGHGIGGRNNAVLFMEEVVRPQEVGCNIYGGGKYSIFAEKLISEYGAKKYAYFVQESNKEKKMTVLDYQAVFEAYRDLNKQFLEEKL